MTDRSKTVVLLIDWDNLQICHERDAPGTELDLQAVIALAQSYGTLVSSRAYAEWNLAAERLMVYKAGIEPVFAPVMRVEGSNREGKSLADTVMVADGVDLLWTVAPDVFVLVTSDKDMIPLARIAKQRGAAVVVLGSDLTAIPLVEMSNVFITYRQLLRELDRTQTLEPPAGRAPARDRRTLRDPRRSLAEPAVGRRGEARPAETPARLSPPPAVVREPVAATPATEDGEGGEGGSMLGDGTARRRRRRGGRSRSRGLAAGTLADGAEGSEAPQAGDADEDLVTPAATGELAPIPIDEAPPSSEPIPSGDDAPAARRREPRSSTTRRNSQARSAALSGPPRFSEFGASDPPAPATTPDGSGTVAEVRDAVIEAPAPQVSEPEPNGTTAGADAAEAPAPPRRTVRRRTRATPAVPEPV
ncbi:MAG: NYN domain-containing protein [Chloroflexota bacterium]